MIKNRKSRILLAVPFAILVSIGLFYRIYYPQSSTLRRSEFVFTDLIPLESTAVKNQGASNTCWSYTGNSFLESEMIRMGKTPVAISPLYTVRMAYLERARNYLRLHGAMPTAAYTGIKAV